MNIISTLKKDILDNIFNIFELDEIVNEEIKSVTITINSDKNEVFGDLSCNAALILSSLLKKAPREIALIIKDELSNSLSKKIEKIEIAGPGFLNFFLKDQFFIEVVKQLSNDIKNFYRGSFLIEKRKYIIEFVSANPTGPMHLGHGRNAIIGDVLSNVLKFLGHDVFKEFYVNDAGLQIKKLGESLKVRCKQKLGYKVSLSDDSYAGNYILDLANSCINEFGDSIISKTDDFFENYAKNSLLENIKTDLAAYGISFDNWFSEKSLHESGEIEKALKLLISKNMAYEKDGALWFRSTEFGDDKDRVVRKKNGELTYIAADIAYHKNKFDRGFDILVDVLGQDHHGYVKRLKATMSALGYNSSNLNVILYQLVTLKRGKEALRMSKRAGDFVTLHDVIETVGSDVARFFYLNRKADAHLEFDLDTALKKTDENPVYYIQYAYVRSGRLLKKAFDQFGMEKSENIDIFEISNSEKDLIKKVVSLQDVLNGIATGYHTHLLAYYSVELAHKFHNYYSNNRIIDVDNIKRTSVRLLMTRIVRDCFDICLDLLGITKPERM